jgi:hypothetical protein
VTRRSATLFIALFLAVQLALAVGAALKLGPLAARWPWGMFDTREPFDRVLVAVGVTDAGERVHVPLERLFRYRRGTTPLAAYHQYPALFPGGRVEERRDFCRYLARRMAARGTQLRRIELAWLHLFVDGGRVERVDLGAYDVP